MSDPHRPSPDRPAHTAAPTARVAAAGAATRATHGAARLGSSWRALSGEYRLAAVAAVGLFASMFLPWYEQTSTGVAKGKPVTASDTLSAFQVFSWVEAAVLVVAIAVLVLCFTRGERKSFHLPGGDGTVVFAGGVWVCFLVFVRQLDKPEPNAVPGLSATMGVQWGIFIAFLFGLLLAYAGLRLRAAHRPEPGPLDEAMASGRVPRDRPGRPLYDPTGADDGDTRVMLPDEEPTRAVPDEEPPQAALPERQRPSPAAPAPATRPHPTGGEQLRLDD